jgi:ABC-type polysaccharide/polyol phosphate transport system ATPase subunit
MAAAMTFERVTKTYRGAREYRVLRDDFAAAAGRLLGRRRTGRHVVRALDDVSFEIPEGESFGLIGANGAGKTTALKLASRIAYPTTGTIRVRGRVGALIEVGTGMHPELTGRENLYLHGRILGLPGREIRRQFDRIVEFADIGSALDQPVKQFSSGMQLRLGFAIAAHLDPDVLLVDEAIAVGDTAFQYRCVQRMSELVREGRTLVFVSHDMSAIETLCSRAVIIREGRIAADGPAPEVVRQYLEGVQRERLLEDAGAQPERREGALEVVAVTLHDDAGREIDEATAGEPLRVRLHYRAYEPVREPIFEVGLGDARIGCFALASMLRDGEVPDVLDGRGYVECRFDTLPLLPRPYDVWACVGGEEGIGDHVGWQRLRRFAVAGELGARRGAVTHTLVHSAPVVLPYSWTVVEDRSARGE